MLNYANVAYAKYIQEKNLSAMSHLRFCRASESRVKVARQNRRCDMALKEGSSDIAEVEILSTAAQLYESRI